MSWRKGRHTGAKFCVARHRRMTPREADSLERTIERRTRREGQEACREGAEDALRGLVYLPADSDGAHQS